MSQELLAKIAALKARIKVLEERNAALEVLAGNKITAPCVIRLPRRERQIVELLLARDLVSRETACAAIYGGCPDSDLPDDKVIDSFISKIRQKLQRRGIALSTERGFGWYLKRAEKAKLEALMAERP